MPPSVTIRVFESCSDLSRAAAERIVRIANEAIERRGRCVVALAGGTTPRHTYERLADAPLRGELLWHDVHVLWGDERMVPPTDAASNFRMAYDALLKYVDIPPLQVHRVLTERGSPERVARMYAETLHDVFASTEGQVPAFDLILLGMGADGHTASLFPHGAALDERTKIVVPARIPGVAEPRITVTPPVLEHAREVMVLATGTEKAAALRAVLDGPYDPHRYPAQVLRQSHGAVTWFVSDPTKDFTRCT